MIKQLINAIGPDLCGGFYTEEITNSSGRIGFKCVSVCGESVEIAHVENPSKDSYWKIRNGCRSIRGFCRENIRGRLVLQENHRYRRNWFYADVIFVFSKIVQANISGSRIVLGTIPLESHPEIDIIKYRKEVRILSMNASNRNTISETLLKDMMKAVEGE